jgi:dCTP deaminase
MASGQAHQAPEIAASFTCTMMVDDVGRLSKVFIGTVEHQLGFDFCLVTASSIGAISEFDGVTQPRLLKHLYRRLYATFGRSLVIHPHQFMHAQTL